jgi:hypothetical protein
LAAEYGAPLPEGDAGLIEAEMRDRQLTARRHALLDEFGDSVEVERIVNGPIEPPEKRLGDFIEETAARTLAGQKARSQACAVAPPRHLCARRWRGKT